MSSRFDARQTQERRHQLDRGRVARRLAPVAFAGLLIVATTGQGSDAAGADVAMHDQARLTGYPADGGLPWYMFPSAPPNREMAVPQDRVFPLELESMGLGIPFRPAAYGVPESVYEAYQEAVASTNVTHPRCNVTWEILAGVGKVESNHAWSGNLDEDGVTSDPILGPLLDGQGVAAIPDTDGGRYDGDSEWDRAVGPMQFIPSTWTSWGADGDGDGDADPHNVYDSTLAAARYLCADGRDLSDSENLDAALYSYNHSDSYVRLVLSWISAYGRDGGPVPDAPGVPAFADVTMVSHSESDSDSGQGDAGDSKRRSGERNKKDSSESDGRQDGNESPPPESQEPVPSVPSVPSLPEPDAPEAPGTPDPEILPKLESTDDSVTSPEPVGYQDYIFKMKKDKTTSVESSG